MLELTLDTAPLSAPDRPCPNCGHHEVTPFYEVRNVPVHSCLMLPTRQAALDFPCGDILLGCCQQCGFITNLLYDPQLAAYAPNYEDQQSFSPTFNRFALEIANRLIDRHNLHDKKIVEIGCSKGDFLLLLCELGNNRGVGIDPSAVVGRVQSSAGDRVQFIQDYYSERYTEHVGELICCRHTLEHIYPTAEFVQTVRRSIADSAEAAQTIVFFELPDTGRILRDLAFEDIYYEHCSYFTPGSLGRLFRHCGFEVTDLQLAYDDQYILIEALPTTAATVAHAQEETVAQTQADVQHFIRQIQQKLNDWKTYLHEAHNQGKRVVIWGSGSKCVSFLTTLQAQDWVEYVVDINPYRQGQFIPGLGKEIMAPEFLKTYQPDQIIIMNPIYRTEIQQMLDAMGVVTELITV
jgi:SAM-dependent methyltransferase